MEEPAGRKQERFVAFFNYEVIFEVVRIFLLKHSCF